MEAAVRSAVEAWLNDPAIADADKTEIRELVARNDEKELTDRFYRNLEFGTGGMRGIIGAGVNRMNIYTVGAAAQGLANYVRRQGPAAMQAGCVIAYDSRHMSDTFARRTASVMAANGITAYLFSALRPTPELSFAVRQLKATTGVVITASHNPPQYNGFKCYWSDGAQVVPPHDDAILREVQNVGPFANVQAMDFEQAREQGLIRLVDEEVDRPFLEAIDASALSPEISRQQGKEMKIVFSPLHGTGHVHVPEALRRRGFLKVTEVPQQAEPDGSFPTVEYPNPEEGAALKLGIELARQQGADLVLATDPDADRVGAAARGRDGEFHLITGNQMAALLTWYICEQHKQAGTLPANGVVITTIVTGEMMKDIARAYGVEVMEVLTGFKWIGEKIRQFEEQGSPDRPSKTYLFGAEESYGYMPGVYTRDKDAVTSAVYIADLAAVAATRGLSLYDLLLELFRQYGYYHETVKNLTLPGKEGADKIVAMMQALRDDPPKSLGGIRVLRVGDLKSGEIRDVNSGAVVERYDLPKSNVIVCMLEDGTRAIARPSGTEPKIKFYILTKEATKDPAEGRQRAERKLKAILDDLMKRAE